uniref:C3H1-type domain-containing protein n=1 Tax=Plectus sambesii TaxID=2011161 RepID=A0A914WDT1_9BILA
MDPPRNSIRSRKGRLSQIKVVEVNSDNLNVIWPHLLLSIKNATIVALDLELSGLGERARMSAKSVDDRYSAIRDAARSRAILSLGVATFRRVAVSEKKKRVRFQVQVYNILSLCDAPFVMEPGALKFLSDHQFDFNRLIQCGVSYHPADSKKTDPLRTLLQELLSSAIPLAFHNGLVDLCFLYQHLYGPLPDTLAGFVSDLTDWFAAPGLLFDSKFVADYQLHWPASYLEYLFRKCQRENGAEAMGSRAYIGIEFISSPLDQKMTDCTEFVQCSLPPKGFSRNAVELDHLCASYANHGFCHKGQSCTKSHDVDLVLDLEDQKREKVRNRRKRRFGEISMNGNGEAIPSNDDVASERKSFAIQGSHRAGIDAFMTGFSILYMNRMSLLKNGTLPDDQANRLPLSGKDIPLMIQTSSWAEKTAYHKEKWFIIEKHREKIASKANGSV